MTPNIKPQGNPLNFSSKFLFLLISLFILLFMAGGVSAANVSACGTLNTAGETYTLTTDITEMVISKCMIISGNNIVLDCQGHTIKDNYPTNESRYAIYATGNNVTIKNCVIDKWEHAIYLSGSNGGTIINNTVVKSGHGIYLKNSYNNNITLNSVSSDHDGVHFESSSNNYVTDNDLSGNHGYSLYDDGDSGCNFVDLSNTGALPESQ